MDLTKIASAIAASELENAGVMADAIKEAVADLATAKQQVTDLTSERDRLAENNATLLGQKGTANNRVKELEQKLADLVATVAQEGEDQEQALERLTNLTQELETTKADLVKAQADKETAIAEKTQLEQSLTFEKAAQRLGLDTVFLDRVLGLEASKLVLPEDAKQPIKIKVEDGKEVSFDDYVKSQPESVQRVVKLALSREEEPAGNESDNNSTAGPTAPPADKGGKTNVRSYLGAQGFNGPAFLQPKS